MQQKTTTKLKNKKASTIKKGVAFGRVAFVR